MVLAAPHVGFAQDPVDKIELSTAPGSVSEDGGAQTVRVDAKVTWAAFPIVSDISLEVHVGKTGDSAVSGTDYHAVSAFYINVKKGNQRGFGSFTFRPIGDNTWEGEEAITIRTTFSNHEYSTTLKMTDPGDQPIVLSTSPSSVSEAASATKITVTATAPGTSSQMRALTGLVGFHGTAKLGRDFRTSDASVAVIIPANQKTGTATFTLTPIQDTAVEGPETVSFQGSSIWPTTWTSVTLTDDDKAPVTLSVSPSSVSEGAGATTVTVTGTASVAASKNSTVLVWVGNRGVDSAEPGIDYAKVSPLSIPIKAGATSGTSTFTLTPTDDTLAEGNETISVHGTAVDFSSVGTATMTLTDNDDFPTVTLLANPSSVGEGAGATSVTVTARAASSVSTARKVTVSVGATGSATSGTDYAAVTDFDITIAPNSTLGTGTFTLTPTQDTLVEGNEIIGITGTSPKATVTYTTVMLNDDDAAPAVNLSVSPSSVGEGDSAKTVTVTAAFSNSSTYAEDKTVAVTVGGSGTATSGTDYAAVSSFDVTIAKGTTSGTGTFTLTPTQDTVVEGSETIGVAGTVADLAVNGATMTLTDDDNHAVTLSVDPSSVGEGDGATQVTVTAKAAVAPPSKLPVMVSVSGGSATPGTDYAAVGNFRIDIPANATSATGTFTLTPTQDTLLEGNETITVWGQGASNLTVTDTSLTLTDDDLPVVTINDASANEGGNMTFTVTLDRAVSGGLTVTLGYTDVTADKNIDYSINTTALSFAGTAGETKTFAVTTLQDTLVESSETFTVGLTVSGTSERVTASDTGTGTVLDDDWPAVTLSANPSSVGEGAGATSVTVTATAASAASAARTVTVAVGGSGTATSGTDYAAVSNFDIAIAAKATSGTGTFTLTPTQDTLIEGNETIGVAGKSPGTQTVTGTALTLTDDDYATLTIDDASATEGSDMTFTVTLDKAVAGGFTVTLGYTDVTADVSIDYAVNTTALSFAGTAGETKTFVVPALQDTLVEPSETFTVGSTVSGTTKTVTATDTGTGTVHDDDKPVLTLSASPSSLSETAGQTSVTVTMTLDQASPTALRVNLVPNGGTATAGTDYTSGWCDSSCTGVGFNIAANTLSVSTPVRITPTQDTLVEGNETITLGGSLTGYTVNPATVTLTDDTRPAVTLSASPSSVGEGAGATTVTVTATAASSIASARTVTVSVGGSGTATSGTDYAAVSNFDITIAANATTGTGTFTLTPTQDTVVEGNETIGVAGTATKSTVTGTTVTLTDDDTAPAVNLSLNPSSVGEGGGATTVTVTAAFSNSSTYAADRTVTVSVGGSGTATSGTDYAAISNFDVTITKGTTSGTATFTLTPTDDSLIEGSETIGVAGTATGLTVNGADLTLTDDDTAPEVNLSLSPSSVSEGASATQVTLTAAFSNGSTYAADKTVTVTVGGSGTATFGTDYAAVSNFDVTITKGTTSGTATFTLTPTDDSLIEGSETIGVAGTVTGLTVNGADLTLTDDDTAPAVNLSLSPSSVSEGASAPQVTVTATFSNSNTYAADKTVTVVVGGSGTATSGTDYAAVSNFDITIATGATMGRGTFTLTPTQDTLIEGSETIGVAGTATGLTVNGADLTLTDDDTAPAVNLTLNPSSVGEGAGATSVTVTAAFSNGSTYAADKTVTVSVGGSGTATSGTDYSAVTGFDVTISAGQTSGTATFTLTPTQDTLIEGSETIGVAGSATGLTVNGADLTLTDDDTAPEVNLSLSPSSVSEGASAPQVTVTATFSNGNTYAADKTVTVVVGGSGTATSGTDYAAVSNFDITIATGATMGRGTFTLTPTQDTLIEGSETIGVAGTATGLTVNGADLTLTDDDTAPAVNLTLNPSSVGEGAGATSLTVTAAFSNGSTYAADKTVTVSVGGSGTATSGTDYSAVSNFDVTIAKGTTSGTATFTLTPTQDTLIEGSETVGVAGTSTGLTVNGADLTLSDDDGAPEVNLSLSPSSVGEGASATTVTVTAAFSNSSTYAADKTVTVAVGGSGTATSGTDYSAVSNFDVTISKGTASGAATFSLTPTQDTLIEGDETIGVAGTATGLTVNGAELTLSDDDGAPEVNLSLSPSSVGEGGSATTVTVTATFSNTSTYAADKTVTVSVGGSGTATSGTDYAAVSNFDVTISTGQTSGAATFSLTPTQDTLIEGDETIGVAGTATGMTVNGADLTLSDDDGAPEVNLSLSPSSVGEGGSATTVTVTATFSNGSTYAADKTVTVSVGGSGTATSGTDYAAVSNFDVTIAKGTTSGTATFSLTPTQDTLIEGDETIGVAGTAAGLTVNGADLTLTDDDGAPEVNLTLNPSSVGEGAGATQVTVTAAFSNGSTYAADKTVTVSVGGSGTATSGTDYAAVSNFDVTISKGATSGAATFSLTPTQDTLIEGDETIGVAGTAAGLTVNGADLTLSDDDGAPEVNLSLSPSSVSEGASATQVTVTAAFSNGSTYATDTTVTVSVGGSGTATSGADYAAVSNFDVTISKGTTSGAATFSLTPTQDTLIEGDETIGVAGAATGLTVNGAELTLTDDDAPATPPTPAAVSLSAAPSSVGEGDGATQVTVTAAFSNGATYATDTTVTVSVGGSGTATSGTDYEAVADFDITIAANATSGTGTFTLTPTDDTLVEGDETIGVAGAATGLTVNGADLTLTDDDAPATPPTPAAVSLSAVPSSVGEGDGATQVTVTATFSNGATYATDTTVTVSVGGSGTATSGTDYEAVADFDITIAANATSGTGTFTLTPTDDTLVEGDETIGVAGTATGLTVNGAELTLTDDDVPAAPPTPTPTLAAVTLSAAPSSVSEGAGARRVTVTATAASAVTSALTVTVSVGGSGTATSGTDYAAVPSFDITIAANATAAAAVFTLTPIEDALLEGAETIDVAGTSPGATVTGTTVTLTDDGAELHVTSARAEEGEGLTFTVTVDKPVPGGFTVTPGYTDGTALAGIDYEPNNSPLKFSGATNERHSFTVATVEDGEVEPDETFLLDLSVTTAAVSAVREGPSGAASAQTHIETASATGTIDNDDAYRIVVKAKINLSPDPDSLREDADPVAVELTAAADGAVPSARTLTVAVGEAGDGATEGTDYAAVADFDLVIPADALEGVARFTLAPRNDGIVEGDETITVSGSGKNMDVEDAVITLEDTDRAKLTMDDASVREGRVAEFTVTLDRAVVGGLLVKPALSDITAEADVDYESGTEPFRFAGEAGERRTISVRTIQDELAEGSETFTLALLPAHDLVGAASATGTIRDDDRAKLTVTDAAADEGESMTFSVTLDNDVPGGLTATPFFTDGTATKGADYAENAAPLTFAGTKGETLTVAVATLQDQIVEGVETFTVGVEAESASGVPVDAGDAGVGTIRDNDREITVSLSLTPETVAEGESAPFRIALSSPSNEVPVTVEYATEDGTATAGADYESANGSVTFQPGETERQVPVLVLDDVKNEPTETFSLRIVNYSGGALKLGASEATAFIDNADPMPAAWLARFGRTAADHAVEAVTERMENGSSEAGAFVPVGGNDLLSSFGGYGAGPSSANGAAGPGHAWAANGGRPVGVLPNGDASPLRQMTDRQFLAASSFTVPLGKANDNTSNNAGDAAVGSSSDSAAPHTLGAPAPPPASEENAPRSGDALAARRTLGAPASPPASEENAPRSGDDSDASDGARWTAWGRGASTRFDGQEGDLSLDGEVSTATVGVDVQTVRWVAGVAVSHSAGDGRYVAPEAADGGTLDSSLTSVTPYARFALNDRVSLWGVFGQGDGDLTMSEDRTGADIRTDLEMTMAAVGVRGVVLPAERANGFELAVRSDAMAVWMDSNASGDMLAAETETSRLRLMLEGSRAFRTDGGGSLRPTLELGLRHDDGDAEQGFGLELGGRLAWSSPGSGLMVEGTVRGVLAHEDEGYEDLSFGGSIRFDPGVEGRGLALSVSPSRGDSMGTAERMWSPHQSGSPYGAGFQDRGDRLETRLSYGLAGPRGRGDLVPYAGLEQWGETKSLMLGSLWQISERTRLEVRVDHRKGNGAAPADNAIQIDFTANR